MSNFIKNEIIFNTGNSEKWKIQELHVFIFISFLLKPFFIKILILFNRSVYERALDVDHRSITLWLKYAEMEMRSRQVSFPFFF